MKNKHKKLKNYTDEDLLDYMITSFVIGFTVGIILTIWMFALMLR